MEGVKRGSAVPKAFDEQMARLVADIKGSRRQPGVDEIRIPFERASRERARRRDEGIVLDRRIVAALRAVGTEAFRGSNQ